MSQANGIFLIMAFVVALIVSYITTPLAEKIAYKVGAVDVPKDARRMHKEPKARLGGLAIFLGFLVSVISFAEFVSASKIAYDLIGILIGAVIIVVLGIFDDIKPRPAKLKFVIQIVAATIAVSMGVRVTGITNPFASNVTVELPLWISYIASILWIVGVTNAVNLLDGLDGLAAGISSIASVALLSILLLMHNNSLTVLVMAAALAGSCFGFLPYNFNPAKLFMGDTGATFLGFILACISVQGPFKTYVAVFVPLMVLGLPIFDTAFAIIRRIIKRQPIMAPDRGHLHHKLIDKGFSHKTTVLILYTLSAVLAIGAILMVLTDMTRGLLFMVFFILVGVYAFNKAGRANGVEEPEKQEETPEEK